MWEWGCTALNAVRGKLHAPATSERQQPLDRATRSVLTKLHAIQPSTRGTQSTSFVNGKRRTEFPGTARPVPRPSPLAPRMRFQFGFSLSSTRSQWSQRTRNKDAKIKHTVVSVTGNYVYCGAEVTAGRRASISRISSTYRYIRT
jgi:hypothetical protein